MCMHSCRERLSSPRAGTRATSSGLKMRDNLPVWRHHGQLVLLLCGVNLAPMLELLRVHRAKWAKAASLGSGEKHPMCKLCFLGHGLYKTWLMKLLQAKGFYYLSSQKKKVRLKKAVLRGPFSSKAFSSLFCVPVRNAGRNINEFSVFCPPLPFPPPCLPLFLNETRYGSTVPIEQTLPLWSCCLMGRTIILASSESNRDQW